MRTAENSDKILELMKLFFLLIYLFAGQSFADTDPYEYALKNMDGKASGLARFFLDVNDDGREDLFVTGKSMFGNAGAPFEVFLSTEKGYQDAGEVFLDNETFQLLNEKRSNIRDIKVCSHMSSSECLLRTYIFDGKRYKKASEQKIAGADFKKQIPTPLKVNIEKSGKQSDWISLNDVVVSGILHKGANYKINLTDDLIFSFEGDGPWTLSIHHKKFPSADLVYAVNPPYRFSSHLTIGEGFNDSARASAKNTPRDFSFIYREKDASNVSKIIKKLLWSKSEQDQEIATDTISKIPKGRGHLEIVSVDFEPINKSEKSAFDETIKKLKFRISFSWPKE